ncbi:DNA-binding protein [Robbsia sp. Bb-Pol-6]|uniref:DNA-binding protein n=1 Tax=Robbsia betulipollinis TaxID=2981849 RepID=A0ABT3ZQZ3_9BURK|nr:PPC domain-containing DNA-binding protein [Robbsia betulipollinis]MCY0388974.1 DNA-binding protein [Robbsia betulipollinis]
MTIDVSIESGVYGRLIVARLKPNEDLIESIEAMCVEHDIQRAVVRGVVGSLTAATLLRGDALSVREQCVAGPGVEILNVFGEVNVVGGLPTSHLSGIVADTNGDLFAGRFKKGANLSFITIEASIQEWLPA